MNDVPSVTQYEEQHSYYAVSSRKWVANGSDVYVKEFVLGSGEEIPWHYHSNVFDVFYCLQGTLLIERADVLSGERLSDVVLRACESAKIDVGTAHRPFNPESESCRFVLVQGVGPYDYIPFRACVTEK
jgi:mannose-6-phosphate isomerase-like protein (cupin superfamily)